MKPTAADIDAICNLVNELCGIYLDNSKDYLIEGRLAKLVKQAGCASYVDFARKVRVDAHLKTEVVNAITTNETLWFRDATPFDALRFKIFPELIDAKAGSLFPKKFRIWSAACSTGQEAYQHRDGFRRRGSRLREVGPPDLRHRHLAGRRRAGAEGRLQRARS